MYSWEEINQVDPEIAQCIKDEVERQNSHIELIASENWVSKAVMAAMGSPLTNKYAEGYPGKRYYGGCECVDEVERLAIERAKELFQCEYVNVQPHSGAQANMAVFFAMLKPGDTVMGMNLAHGGHLSHGSPANFSGAYFHIVPYGVNDQGVIDYEEVRKIALESKPKLIVAGASAYCRIIDFKKFREIADEVGAYLMVDIAHIAGLVAAGVHPSPIPYAHVTTTTTHKTLRGPRGGMIMSSAEIAKKFNLPGRHHPQRDGDGHRQYHAGAGEEQRGPEPLDDEVGHVLPIVVGAAQIPMEKPCQPQDVPGGQGPVQTEGGLHSRLLRGAGRPLPHKVGEVSGRQIHQQKDEDGDTEENWDGGDKPPADILCHCVPSCTSGPVKGTGDPGAGVPLRRFVLYLL